MTMLRICRAAAMGCSENSRSKSPCSVHSMCRPLTEPSSRSAVDLRQLTLLALSNRFIFFSQHLPSLVHSFAVFR